MRVNPIDLEQLLYPQLHPGAGATPIGEGLAASPGAACGVAVFDADRAEELGGEGVK